VNRRVVVLNHFAAPRGAPGGTRHVELFSRLRRWDATVIGSRVNYLTREPVHLDDDLYRTVPVLPYRSNGAARILNWCSYAVTALVAALRLPRPDVVYASSPHLLTGLAGWALARLRRASFVLELRDLWPVVLVEMGQLSRTSPLYRLLRSLERFLYRKADAIVVLAEGVRRVLVEDEGVAADRVYFVPNGADPADFVPSAPRAALRERYGLDGMVFAYTGAHGPANGLDLVLDAAAEVAEQLPDVRFLLVGDGVAKAALRERAAREGLRNVAFRAPVPKDEMPDLLGAVDVGLHVLADVPLFRYGVSPNKLYDYLAAGLPVLTNTGGEVAALVDAANAGVAVAPDGIADGVRALAGRNAEELRRFGDDGRAYLAATRSRSSLAERVETLLDDLAGARA
jgi:glycosyltransferase involved in cell wall biosynthesis